MKFILKFIAWLANKWFTKKAVEKTAEGRKWSKEDEADELWKQWKKYDDLVTIETNIDLHAMAHGLDRTAIAERLHDLKAKRDGYAARYRHITGHNPS